MTRPIDSPPGAPCCEHQRVPGARTGFLLLDGGGNLPLAVRVGHEDPVDRTLLAGWELLEDPRWRLTPNDVRAARVAVVACVHAPLRLASPVPGEVLVAHCAVDGRMLPMAADGRYRATLRVERVVRVVAGPGAGSDRLRAA